MDLTKLILIGLPGTGKTTLNNEIAKQANLGIVSTDDMIKREYKNPENPIIKGFMESHNLDHMITTSEIAEKFGEPEYRDLESNLIINELENGRLENKIVDLGGKAFLHPKTQKKLKSKGYKAVYLKINEKNIVDHLLKDYKKYSSGQAGLFRSNYNLKAKQTEEDFKKNNPSLKEQELDIALRKSLYKVSEEHRKEREALYEKASDYKIEISGDLKKDLASIQNIVKQENQKSLSLSFAKGKDNMH